MENNIEVLLQRIEFKKKFIEEYRKKCLEKADVFSSYEKLTEYCDAKLDAYSSVINDIHELFSSTLETKEIVK